MLCTTNIWIKIQKCTCGRKNLHFLPTFVTENSPRNPKNGTSGIVIRQNARPARSPLRRVGNAALRRAADRPLALRPPHGGPAANDRHRRRAPPAARRAVFTGAERPGARHRVGRRHEKIPVPHPGGALRRGGLHPRRRAGHALRLVAGRMPHGLPLLRHGAAGASRVAHGGRNPQPGGFAARARQTHEPRVHGHGRTNGQL